MLPLAVFLLAVFITFAVPFLMAARWFSRAVVGVYEMRIAERQEQHQTDTRRDDPVTGLALNDRILVNGVERRVTSINGRWLQ